MMLLFVTLMCHLLAMTDSKVFERCDLAWVLKGRGMSGYRGVSLNNWMCAAYHESRFDTSALGPPNSDGSRDYGIFQMSSLQWCDSGDRPTANRCRTPCSAFTNDDISDDIECAKMVVSDPQGMDAWGGWTTHCKGKNVSQWTRDCGV